MKLFLLMSIIIISVGSLTGCAKNSESSSAGSQSNALKGQQDIPKVVEPSCPDASISQSGSVYKAPTLPKEAASNRIKLEGYDADTMFLYPMLQPFLEFSKWRMIDEFTETNYGTAQLDYDKKLITVSVIVYDPSQLAVEGPSATFTVNYETKSVVSCEFLNCQGKGIYIPRERLVAIAQKLKDIADDEYTKYKKTH